MRRIVELLPLLGLFALFQPSGGFAADAPGETSAASAPPAVVSAGASPDTSQADRGGTSAPAPHAENETGTRSETSPSQAEKGEDSIFTRDSLFRLSNLFVLRFTPFGFEDQAAFGFSRPLYKRQDKLFFNTHYGLSAIWKINPSFTRIGASFDLQPVAFLRLQGGYEYVRYFGLFGFPHSYPAPTSSFPDDLGHPVLDSGYATGGHHFFVQPMFQAIAGDVVFISRWTFEYWDLALAAGDNVFYDTIVGTLVPGKGWVISTDTDLVYVHYRVVAGLRYSGVWPGFSDEVIAASASDPGASASRHRLGPFVAYPFGTGKARLKAPALTLLTGVYLGGSKLDQAQRFYALLAFSFSIGVGK